MNVEPLFVKVEAAVDAHPRLNRVQGINGEPTLNVSRFGFTVLIPVRPSPETMNLKPFFTFYGRGAPAAIPETKGRVRR